jgi:hypothetical protein
MTREQLEKDIAAYLDAGGKITQCNEEHLDREIIDFNQSKTAKNKKLDWNGEGAKELYRNVRPISSFIFNSRTVNPDVVLAPWKTNSDYLTRDSERDDPND